MWAYSIHTTYSSVLDACDDQASVWLQFEFNQSCFFCTPALRCDAHIQQAQDVWILRSDQPHVRGSDTANSDVLVYVTGVMERWRTAAELRVTLLLVRSVMMLTYEGRVKDSSSHSVIV